MFTSKVKFDGKKALRENDIDTLAYAKVVEYFRTF